ncbi:MAG TPA: sugar ABC transporter permease [Rectinemataceae bacterium]|nr:sugar ABC transporter permease [Rectinemataceae bacterium]
MTASARRTLKKNAVAYSFILPNFMGFAVFTLAPMLFAMVLSFMSWDGANPITFVGLKNFEKMLHDETFRISTFNTLYYVIGTVFPTLAFSLLLAVLLNRDFKGRNFFRAVFFFPYVGSLVAVSVVWNMMFHPSMGPINNLLGALGMRNPPAWSASTKWAMPTVIMASIWRNAGYYMIIYLAALQGIPRELYEAAKIDGASSWQAFRKITVPLLTPATFFVTMMLTITSFKVFDLIYVMTGGGPGRATNVLVFTIYDSAFISFEYGYSSAIAMVLFAIVLAITLMQFRMEKKWVSYL